MLTCGDKVTVKPWVEDRSLSGKTGFVRSINHHDVRLEVDGVIYLVKTYDVQAQRVNDLPDGSRVMVSNYVCEGGPNPTGLTGTVMSFGLYYYLVKLDMPPLGSYTNEWYFEREELILCPE